MARIQSRMPQQRPGHPAQSETGQAITLHFVLNALRQWWKIATPVGLVLAVCAAGLVYWTFTPMYKAWTTIEIKDTAPYLAFQKRDNTGRVVQTQLQPIRHPRVLIPALEELAGLPELKDQEDQVAWLQTKIGVEQRGESVLYDITFAGPDAENAKTIVEEVRLAYLAQHRVVADQNTQKVIALLKGEEESRKVEVEELRQLARQLTIDNLGMDPYEVKSQQEPDEDAAFATVRSQLVNAEVDTTILEARATVLEARLAELTPLKAKVAAVSKARRAEEAKIEDKPDPAPEGTPPSGTEAAKPVLSPEEEQLIVELVPAWMVEQVVDADPEVQFREQELAAKRSKLIDIARLAVNGKGSKLYINLAKEIADERVGLDTFRKNLKERHRTNLVEQRVLEHEAQLSELKLALKSQKILMTTLEEKRTAQEDEGKTYRGITFDMEIATKNLADSKRVLDLIRDRRIELEAEAKAADRVTLFWEATASKDPSDPYKKMLLAALAGMLLPFGLAVLWERLAKRVAHPKDLQRQSTLPVVGEIARIPSRARAAGGFASGAGGFALGVFEESIDSLRTNLVLAEDLQEMRVLAVTSAVNHEGKTSVSAQLAISLARASGKKTLLIDGDMRCPDIHNVFDIPLEPGLAEVLSGECSLEDAIVTDWSDHVHLVPAGKLRMSPHKLLGNGSAEELLASISDIYRYVIIDTPPVLAASEALVLAKAADASLICAMQDVSRIDQVAAACHRLESAGSRPVGTVLNGVPTKRYAYRYGSYAYSRQ